MNRQRMNSMITTQVNTTPFSLYSNPNTPHVENYCSNNSNIQPMITYNTKNLAENRVVTRNGKKYNQAIIQTSEALPFCNDEISIDPPDMEAVTLNQNLTGNLANPKTNIPPVVFAHSHDLDYWKDNNLIVHSRINSRGIQEEMYLSGYAEST